MSKTRQHPKIDPQLNTLIQSHVRHGEIIRRICYSSRSPDEVSAHLMPQELYEKLQKAKMPRVRGSGGGRVLSFKREQGEWHFAEEGFWIT